MLRRAMKVVYNLLFLLDLHPYMCTMGEVKGSYAQKVSCNIFTTLLNVYRTVLLK